MFDLSQICNGRRGKDGGGLSVVGPPKTAGGEMERGGAGRRLSHLHHVVRAPGDEGGDDGEPLLPRLAVPVGCREGARG